VLILSDQHHDHICAASPIGAGTDLRVVRPTSPTQPSLSGECPFASTPNRVTTSTTPVIDYPRLDHRAEEVLSTVHALRRIGTQLDVVIREPVTDDSGAQLAQAQQRFERRGDLWRQRGQVLDAIGGQGTVTLIEMCSGAVNFRAVAMDQRGVVGISGGSVYRVERGNLTPGREAFSHLGSPSGCAEPVPSRPKVSADAAKG